MTEEFKTTGMMLPWSNEYENEFEKQVYMAINIFRANPKRWAPIIQQTYQRNRALDTRSQRDLINAVKSMEKMPGICFDAALNAAARKNNVEVTTVDTRTPKEGGNIAALTGTDKSIKVENCQEVTMIEYLGQDAEEFVTLVMIKCWDNPNAVKDEKVVEKKESSALPGVTETEVTDTKPKNEGAAKEAQKAADPRLRCPLFEPLTSKMGMSNKAHRYRKNVIQLLFTRDQLNTME